MREDPLRRAGYTSTYVTHAPFHVPTKIAMEISSQDPHCRLKSVTLLQAIDTDKAEFYTQAVGPPGAVLFLVLLHLCWFRFLDQVPS